MHQHKVRSPVCFLSLFALPALLLACSYNQSSQQAPLPAVPSPTILSPILPSPTGAGEIQNNLNYTYLPVIWNAGPPALADIALTPTDTPEPPPTPTDIEETSIPPTLSPTTSLKPTRTPTVYIPQPTDTQQPTDTSSPTVAPPATTNAPTAPPVDVFERQERCMSRVQAYPESRLISQEGWVRIYDTRVPYAEVESYYTSKYSTCAIGHITRRGGQGSTTIDCKALIFDVRITLYESSNVSIRIDCDP